jgi:hypothetical protein
MVFQAALVAARPNSSLKAPSMVIQARLTQRYAYSEPSSKTLSATKKSAAFLLVLHAGNRLSDFGALEFLPSRTPSSTRGHASGPFRRPAARRRSASTTSPLRGLGPSQNKFEDSGKERRSNFFRPRHESTPWHLGAGPTRSLCEG